MPRRPHRWIWVRETTNNASPSATLNNLDFLSAWRTHTGISVNLPEITVWRFKLKISIRVTLAAAVQPNDGVLLTTFVDSTSQTLSSQLTNPFDQPDMIYEFMYCNETTKMSGLGAAAASAMPLYVSRDIRARRKLRSIDDSLQGQLAASGQAQITHYSYSSAILLKLG